MDTNAAPPHRRDRIVTMLATGCVPFAIFAGGFGPEWEVIEVLERVGWGLLYGAAGGFIGYMVACNAAGALLARLVRGRRGRLLVLVLRGLLGVGGAVAGWCLMIMFHLLVTGVALSPAGLRVGLVAGVAAGIWTFVKEEQALAGSKSEKAAR